MAMAVHELVDLIDAEEVARLCGLSYRNTVSQYQRQYPAMPRPKLELGPGRPRLWSRTEIARWQRSRRQHHVDSEGRYDGRSLREWVDPLVSQLIPVLHPQRVILFGSVARCDDGPDSDIDLMVVVDELGDNDKRSLIKAAYAGITIPVPVDILITTPKEIEERKAIVGTPLYWALREGQVVYER